MYSATGDQKYLQEIIDFLYIPHDMLSFSCIDILDYSEKI